MSKPSKVSTRQYLSPCYATSSMDEFMYRAPEVGDGRASLPSPTSISQANTGRKTWKTLREKKEAVWPPYIEAALLEALQKYRPTSARDPALLQRFPKRNRFISEYIFTATGKVRTPKQVGSRLQQLRDTCTEERVLSLLTRRTQSSRNSPSEASGQSIHPRQPPLECGQDYAPRSASPASYPPSPISSSSSYGAGSPLELLNPLFPTDMASNANIQNEPVVQISFLLQSSMGDGPSYHASIIDHGVEISVDGSSRFLNNAEFKPQQAIHTLQYDDIPTITFSTPISIPAEACHTTFTIYHGDSFIHSESAALFNISGPKSANIDRNFVYGSKLAPDYWPGLRRAVGLYTVHIAVNRVHTTLDADYNLRSSRYTEATMQVQIGPYIDYFSLPYNQPHPNTDGFSTHPSPSYLEYPYSSDIQGDAYPREHDGDCSLTLPAISLSNMPPTYYDEPKIPMGDSMPVDACIWTLPESTMGCGGPSYNSQETSIAKTDEPLFNDGYIRVPFLNMSIL